MNEHNSGKGIIVAIEIGAVLLSAISWTMLVGYAGRLRSNFLVGGIAAIAALVMTMSTFIPFLFISLLTGGSGEAMLATLPLTLIGAPIAFVVILLALMKTVRARP
jgi:hypothetical protein